MAKVAEAVRKNLMRQADVLIAGGGLAGSLAAAMLGRAGIDAVLVDPHAVYPADFRCEKLDAGQLQTLKLTALDDAVIRASTRTANSGWRASAAWSRSARAISAAFFTTRWSTPCARRFPAGTAFIHAKVTDVSTGPERQTVKLSNGDEIAARLVVVATGLNIGLCQKLGLQREVISPGHSISVGFDVQPADRLPFTALTYFAERPADRMAYITLFPIGSTMRANLFGYRDLHDPWLKQFRDAPRETLYAMWPDLRRLLGDFTVSGFVKIRPVDLTVTQGHRQNGIVLVGDAFATSCPAAGNGARKVLVDVERLCNVYIPRWLATPGMGASEDRGVLRRSGQAGVRHARGHEGVRASLILDRKHVALDGDALGEVLRPMRARARCGP